MKQLYDEIGKGYTRHRAADHRIVEKLMSLVDQSPPATLADVGAGTGNYSRALADLGFSIQAIEPARAMRSQSAPHEKVNWHDSTAERLPLEDNSVDAVVCVLASHHFSSTAPAIAEMARVCPSGPIVWLTFYPREAKTPWLADYFPTIWESAYEAFPPLDRICELLAEQSDRQVEVSPFPVPHDLEDWFAAAGWRRPQLYLDPDVRASMSAFALGDRKVVNQGLSRLQDDLETGHWQSTHGALLGQDTVDWGYRFLKAI